MEEVKKQIGLQGNGRGEELNDEQISLVHKLCNDEAVLALGKELDKSTKSADDESEGTSWLNYEVCRRFLVARSWVYKDALAQLVGALEWRIKTRFVTLLFIFLLP